MRRLLSMIGSKAGKSYEEDDPADIANEPRRKSKGGRSSGGGDDLRTSKRSDDDHGRPGSSHSHQKVNDSGFEDFEASMPHMQTAVLGRRRVMAKRAVKIVLSPEQEEKKMEEEKEIKKSKKKEIRERRELLKQQTLDAAKEVEGGPGKETILHADEDEGNKQSKFAKAIAARRSYYFGESVLEGGFQVRHGTGVRMFAPPPRGSGDIYEGLWVMGQMRGVGIMRFHAGKDSKKGQFHSNQISGSGIYEFGVESKWPGDTYVGSFFGGKKHGVGVYTFMRLQACYKGEFARGQFNGWGRLVTGCEKYEGQFDMDRKQGLGMQHWQVGYDEIESQYSGEFLNNKRTGLGVLVYKDGSRFCGQFKDGMLHGMGKLELATEEFFYEGTWSFGRKHGSFTVGRESVQSKEWQTHEYKFDELVAVREYDFRVDFMNVSSRVRAVALAAEEMSEHARVGASSKLNSVLTRVAEMVRSAERNAEAAEDAAREARALAVQSENYRIRRGFRTDDMVKAKRRGKTVLVHRDDYDPSEDVETTSAGALIQSVQKNIRKTKNRLFTSFAQSRPKEREFKTQTKTFVDENAAAMQDHRIKQVELQDLLKDLANPSYATFSKLRMVDSVVQQKWLTMRELTEIIQYVSSQKEKWDILERYHARLANYQYPEDLIACFDDQEKAKKYVEDGESLLKAKDEERKRQQKEKGFTDKDLEIGAIGIESVYDKREKNVKPDDEEEEGVVFTMRK